MRGHGGRLVLKFSINAQDQLLEKLSRFCPAYDTNITEYVLDNYQDTVPLDSNKIPVRITYQTTKESTNMRNTVNHGVIKRVPYRKSHNVPTVLSTNVRTIGSKVDEIQQIAELNNANAI